MFIIDFDDTLFDTQAFKQARLLAVERLGVSEEEFWRTYRDARNDPDGNATYTNERHAETLALIGYDYAEVLAQLESTGGDELYRYLFSHTIDFLEGLRTHKQPMLLLSLGNPGFQEMKTKGTGVEAYFDRVFFVHDTKAHVLEDIFRTIEERDVWFVNDKIEETQKLVQQFSVLHAVLKMSERFSKKEYDESDLPHFETLREIGDYIGENI